MKLIVNFFTLVLVLGITSTMLNGQLTDNDGEVSQQRQRIMNQFKDFCKVAEGLKSEKAKEFNLEDQLGGLLEKISDHEGEFNQRELRLIRAQSGVIDAAMTEISEADAAIAEGIPFGDDYVIPGATTKPSQPTTTGSSRPGFGSSNSSGLSDNPTPQRPRPGSATNDVPTSKPTGKEGGDQTNVNTLSVLTDHAEDVLRAAQRIRTVL